MPGDSVAVGFHRNEQGTRQCEKVDPYGAALNVYSSLSISPSVTTTSLTPPDLTCKLPHSQSITAQWQRKKDNADRRVRVPTIVEHLKKNGC